MYTRTAAQNAEHQCDLGLDVFRVCLDQSTTLSLCAIGRVSAIALMCTTMEIALFSMGSMNINVTWCSVIYEKLQVPLFGAIQLFLGT